jgi:hypothetical protein
MTLGWNVYNPITNGEMLPFFSFENEHGRRGGEPLKRSFAKPLQGIHAHFTSCLCNGKAIPPNQKKKPQTVMDASRLGFAQE